MWSLKAGGDGGPHHTSPQSLAQSFFVCVRQLLQFHILEMVHTISLQLTWEDQKCGLSGLVQ